VSQNPAVKVQRLSSTDGFIVWDLDEATMSAGIVRMARKVLQDGAVMLARSVTYTFASFGVRGHGGASAALNAKPEQRDTAMAAFVEEVRPYAEQRRLRLTAGSGISDSELAPLGWDDVDTTLTAAGALAAARAAAPAVGFDGLEGRSVAIVGAGPVAEATATAATEDARAVTGDSRFDADADVLFVAGKVGCLDHDTASTVRARLIVPLTPVPVTARALAVLGRADRVVVPDFLSTAASWLAIHDPAGGDPDGRVADAVTKVADEGTGMWLAAAFRAEEYLATWAKEQPFGRPLA
jgi:hypothetical protein